MIQYLQPCSALLTLQGVAAPCHLLVCSIQGSLCQPPYRDQACPSCSTPGTPTCSTPALPLPYQFTHNVREWKLQDRPLLLHHFTPIIWGWIGVLCSTSRSCWRQQTRNLWTSRCPAVMASLCFPVSSLSSYQKNWDYCLWSSAGLTRPKFSRPRRAPPPRLSTPLKSFRWVDWILRLLLSQTYLFFILSCFVCRWRWTSTLRRSLPCRALLPLVTS